MSKIKTFLALRIKEALDANSVRAIVPADSFLPKKREDDAGDVTIARARARASGQSPRGFCPRRRFHL